MTPDGPAGSGRRTPYMGLMPYLEQDADLFFGRDAEADLVAANLLAARFTVLYGASGVGKSSLLRAGVLPQLAALARRALEEDAPPLVVVLFSEWAGNPVTGILEGIRAAAAELLGDRRTPPWTEPPALDAGLAWWSRQLNADLLVVLDQFEESFLYHEEEGEAGSFATAFPHAVTRPDLRANFLVAIREDALAGLDRFKGRIPNLLEHGLRIDHLGWDAAREAVERPLAVGWGGREAVPVAAERELVEAVLEQVTVGRVALDVTGRGAVERASVALPADARVQTPYLQLVMVRLWEEEARTGSRRLRLATLRALGGADRIIRTHLDAAMEALPPEEQDIAARILHFLVTPSGSKISHSAKDLAEYAEVSEPDVVAIVEKFCRGDTRILRPVAPPLDRMDVPRYEIFHDVLAPAVLDWRARYVAARRAKAELAARIGAEIEAKQAAEERAHAYRRTARITRTVALVMTLMFVLMAALAVLAWQGWRSTVRAQASIRSGELTQRALATLASDPAISLQLAADAIDQERTDGAERVLRQALDESRVRVVMRGHQDWVTGVAYSRDGALVATASNDRTVRVWNPTDGSQKAVLRLDARPSSLVHPEFSPNGQRVLITTDDGTAWLWSWRQSGDPVALGKLVTAAAFGPNEGEVVTGDRGGRVQVWNARTRRRHGRSLTLATAPVTVLAVSPDRRWLAAGDEEGRTRIWDARSGSGKVLAPGAETGSVNAVAWSRDGSRLVVGTSDGTARILALGRRGPIGPPVELDGSGRDSPVERVAFDATGLVLTAGGKTASVWRTDGARLAELRGHTAAVLDAAFAPNGVVVTASADGTARVWEGRTGTTLFTLRGHSDSVLGVAVSPDGHSVETAGADGTVRRWDVSAGDRYGGRRKAATGATLNAAGDRIVIGGANGTADIWDLAGTWPPLATIPTRSAAVTAAALDARGHLAVTGSDDGMVRVWTVRDRPELVKPRKVPGGDLVSAVAFDPSPGGRDRILLGLGFTGTAEIWDWRDGRPPVQLRQPTPGPDSLVLVKQLFGAAFSPDGRLVVTAHRDKMARLWDAGSGHFVRTLAGHTSIVYGAAFSADGSQVVTAGGDGTARIWRTATGQPLRTLAGQGSAIRAASFSRDGRLIAGGDAEGATFVWEVATGRLLAVLRRHADSVNSTAFTRDGEIVSASDDGTAKRYPCDTCGSLADLLARARERERYTQG